MDLIVGRFFLFPDIELAIMSHLEMGLPYVLSCCPTVSLLKILWKYLKTGLQVNGYLKNTLLLYNRNYAELAKLPGFHPWQALGMWFIAQVYSMNVLISQDNSFIGISSPSSPLQPNFRGAMSDS